MEVFCGGVELGGGGAVVEEGLRVRIVKLESVWRAV